jgi:hypothetical protein
MCLAVLFLCSMYASRGFSYQIREDANEAIVELEATFKAAFKTASDVIRDTPNALQWPHAQGNPGWTRHTECAAVENVSRRPEAHLPCQKRGAETGMRNVEGAVRFLAQRHQGQLYRYSWRQR